MSAQNNFEKPTSSIEPLHGIRNVVERAKYVAYLIKDYSPHPDHRSISFEEFTDSDKQPRDAEQ